MDTDEIREKIRNSNLCFKCFRPSHLAKNCKSKCEICHKGHHKVFCYQNQSADKQNTNRDKDSLNKAGGSDNCVIYAKSEFTGRQTVMQSCKVKVNDVDVFVLFDSAADKSYISFSCVKSLKPKFIGKEETSFFTFGGG